MLRFVLLQEMLIGAETHYLVGVDQLRRRNLR